MVKIPPPVAAFSFPLSPWYPHTLHQQQAPITGIALSNAHQTAHRHIADFTCISLCSPLGLVAAHPSSVPDIA
eukprot:52638-Rhodomonas_salina.1